MSNETSVQVLNKVIPATDTIDLEFADYISDQFTHVREDLNDPRGRIDSNDFSYRIINHWEENELFRLERGTEGGGWRRFSAMDRIWLEIISELRGFGVSTEKIKKIRLELESKNKTSLMKYPRLEFYVARYMAKREATYLMVFSDFTAQIACEFEISIAELFQPLSSHLRIDLSAIVQKIFIGDLKRAHKPSFTLSDSETELLLAVRVGAYNEIKVVMRDGQIIRFEKEKAYVEKDIFKLIKEAEYQTITMHLNDGKVSHIKQVIKQKP
jgi:DNA-binding transcriptional MerR regulator